MRHRAPDHLHLVPAALAALVLATAPAAAASADSTSVFTARAVPVDAVAETAARARDLALADGQRRALVQVLERVTFRADHDRLPLPDLARIPDLVEAIQVADEKTSSTRYLARLTVDFRDDLLRELLRDAAIPFTETRAKPTLVLPVYEEAGALRLFDDDNPWRDAWRRYRQPEDGLLPLLLPLGDLQDVAAIGPEQALAGDAARLEAIGARHGAESVLVAHAALRLDFAAAATRRLQLALHRFGSAGGGVEIDSLPLSAEGPLSAQLDEVVERVAVRLEEEWKQQTALRFGAEQRLSVRVPLDGFAGWLEVRRRLERNAMVQRMDLASISRRDAQLVLHFLGHPSQLSVSLAQDDLELVDQDGFWVLQLRRRASGREPPGPVAE